MTDHAAPARPYPVVFRALRAAVVALIAALSFLPIGTWLDTTFQRALSFQAIGWWSGALLVLLLAAAFTVVLRNDARATAFEDALAAVIRAWERRPVAGAIVIAATAAVVYAVTAWMVFDARPLLIDEIVQVIQARVFATGRLWLPLDAHPEFRAIMHMVEQDGRWYGQFPPGGPAMLALGELFRSPWIVNPVCGGISVAAFATMLRWRGVRPGVSLGATLAFGFAPFVVFQSASYMNHVTALMWLTIAAAALVYATRDASDRAIAGLVCGLALGAAATIRPLDAAAWALPAGAWLGWRAVRGGAWKAFLASGVGVALPFAAMMWVNAQTTGGPLTFGYTVLWGESHGLGFHESPWGERHDVSRALALVAAYFNRLNEYLYELPVPSLIPALAALLLARSADALERYLYASGALLVGAYFAYWHDGFYLGPRFLYPLAPLAALLLARLPSIVRERWPHPLVGRALASSYLAAVLLGMTMVLPPRVRAYAQGFHSVRWDYDALASAAGARDGIVLVRESWGAQIIYRMWALGVSRSFTEILYRHVDACGLHDRVSGLERDGIRDRAAEDALRPLLADSARVVASELSPDATERMLPGSMYTQDCWERILEDRGGYTHFAPVWLTRDTTILWLRDLHARDTLVIARDTRRPIWLLRRDPATDPGVPVFVRIDGDSLRRAWRGADPPAPASSRR